MLKNSRHLMIKFTVQLATSYVGWLDLGDLFPSFDYADLLHHTQLIRDEPFLNDLPLLQTEHSYPSNRDVLAARSNAKEPSLMRSPLRHTDHHLVSFGDEILNRCLPIREGCQQQQHSLFITLTPRSGSRKRIVVDRIGGKDLECSQIPCVQGIKQVTDQPFVLFY